VVLRRSLIINTVIIVIVLILHHHLHFQLVASVVLFLLVLEKHLGRQLAPYIRLDTLLVTQYPADGVKGALKETQSTDLYQGNQPTGPEHHFLNHYQTPAGWGIASFIPAIHCQ